MQDYQTEISKFIQRYSEMDILGTIIPCPYWMNKIKDGAVIARGFENGKGGDDSIKNEIIKKVQEDKIEKTSLNPILIQKLCRRYRIGIDCSGFAYRLLDMLVKLRYYRVNISSLDEIFVGGIHKTNVKKLIDPAVSIPIDSIEKTQLGDLISVRNGKHILVIFDYNKTEITYIHASYRDTRLKGVHTQKITIKNSELDLSHQQWHEQSSTKENYAQKYFHPQDGDGIYRLKIFQ
jgi:hypothetical protein